MILIGNHVKAPFVNKYVSRFQKFPFTDLLISSLIGIDHVCLELTKKLLKHIYTVLLLRINEYNYWRKALLSKEYK